MCLPRLLRVRSLLAQSVPLNFSARALMAIGNAPLMGCKVPSRLNSPTSIYSPRWSVTIFSVAPRIAWQAVSRNLNLPCVNRQGQDWRLYRLLETDSHCLIVLQQYGRGFLLQPRQQSSEVIHHTPCYAYFHCNRCNFHTVYSSTICFYKHLGLKLNHSIPERICIYPTFGYLSIV